MDRDLASSISSQAIAISTVTTNTGLKPTNTLEKPELPGQNGRNISSMIWSAARAEAEHERDHGPDLPHPLVAGLDPLQTRVLQPGAEHHKEHDDRAHQDRGRVKAGAVPAAAGVD